MTEYVKIWGPFYDNENANYGAQMLRTFKFYFIAIGIDHRMRHLQLSYDVAERKWNAHAQLSRSWLRTPKGVYLPEGPPLPEFTASDPPNAIPGKLVDALVSIVPDDEMAQCTAASIRKLT